MPYRHRRQHNNHFAVMASLATLLGALAVAPGCDDVTARSFGGNAAETGGVSGLSADGGLARGHGGATASITVAGTGGTTAPDAGAPSTPAPAPSSTGGVTGQAPAGTGGSGVTATGGTVPPSAPSGSGGVTAVTPVASGGATASGGAPSSVSATGGVTGSGGNATPVPAATGGMGGASNSGAGGKPASGATGGAPGKTTPGTGGAPSQGDTGGRTSADTDTCMKLISDYDTAVTKGKACDAGGKGASCSKAVAAKLSGCGAACTTFVDDDSMAKMVQQQWTKAGCTPDACAVEVCVSPTGASCAGDGSKGTCTDSLLGL